MPEIFINGQSVQAEKGQTVLQAALANGFYIPYFCWHPNLSIAGNCRICVVQPEGKNWVEIACNMPVADGVRVLTDSDLVREHRQMTLQFILLNHPVDCGICDKAGECSLQDYHVAYNGQSAGSIDAKVHAEKYYDANSRIVLDHERCIKCSRCVRFTHEISKSNGLGMLDRADHSAVRAADDGSFERDAYSDNVIDICPVGALLSKSFLHKSRVWYLKPTASICPGCARGCTVDIWHRKPEWTLKALDARQNETIARVTPRENPEVNGPWICNKGRDLAKIFERPRAEVPMQKGKPLPVANAIEAARTLIAKAKNPVALVSSWGSNEELAAFKAAFGSRLRCFVKADATAQPGEVVEDDLLIRADKNPNTTEARTLFGSAPITLDAGVDVVVVWGEGFNFDQLPRGAKVILLGSYMQPEVGYADVFFPISVQTERAGHYTNFEGVVSAFQPCFKKGPSVMHAEELFRTLGATAGVTA